MSEHNSFQRILARLDEADTPTEKTAEQTTPSPSAQDRMMSIVSDLSKTAATAPSAPTSKPVEDLAKLASDAQATEEQQLVKQSQFLGAAFADGFMERFAQYDSALASQGAKTASAAPAQVSQEQAFHAGVKHAEEQATASYQQGYQDQMQEVHKIATDLHYSGQLLANQVVEAAKAANTK